MKDGGDKSTRPSKPRGPRPLADLVSDLVDPIVSKRAGMTAGLLSAWPEIAGLRLEQGCRPEKLLWPPRRSDDDPFEPATLVVACEGAYVLRLQHEAQDLLTRVNGYFGYPAVSRLRIVQKPVQIHRVSRKVPSKPIGPGDRQMIAEATSRIENPRLRSALERFGETVLGRNAAERDRGGR
ncbi:hypothetical protein NS365_06865 [Aureimonas ureilytica]|uniref:DUF721 domain-containing protein n=1 Tax=Aureimonas ureilytica TaxID=401562 RepID=A0A175RT07_9HYPH|nr:DciA family protein [Aureimonas ureilytica]KTR06591.1 hypothetical protein NS365_06865 [Aureimonas ureilytica]